MVYRRTAGTCYGMIRRRRPRNSQRNLRDGRRPMKSVAAAAILAASLAASGDAKAQTPEQFYKGKQIELAIGYPPAGSNDVYARLLARHLGKHIPGNPTIVPQNRPGAGSFLALGYMANVAPKDGSVIAIGAPTAPLD